jgi:hypothetical protein
MSRSNESWTSPADRSVAAAIVDRLKTGLAPVTASYEEAARRLVDSGVAGTWSWHTSELLAQRILVTDVYEDLRRQKDFDGMAVSWKEHKDRSGAIVHSPPAIQALSVAGLEPDVLEHESIHVAQLLVDHEFPGKPRDPFPGPIPMLSRRIIMEFEAHLVQSVHFERAFQKRLILDLNCVESAQLAALRAGFSVYVGEKVREIGTSLTNTDSPVAFSMLASGIVGELLEFGDSVGETFRGSVLEQGNVVPGLDQLAFHLFTQVNAHTSRPHIGDSRRVAIVQAFAPVFRRWSNFMGADPFEILNRFRPPNPPPRLNEAVIY